MPAPSSARRSVSARRALGLLTLLALGACAAPFELQPAVMGDLLHLGDQLAGLPLRGDGALPFTEEDGRAAVAAGRVRAVEWTPDELALLGLVGGDVANVRVLGGRAGLAVLAEPAPNETPESLAGCARSFGLELQELAYLCGGLGLVYATDRRQQIYVVARPQPEGREPEFVGLLRIRRRAEFLARPDVVEVEALRAWVAEACRAEREDEVAQRAKELAAYRCAELEELFRQAGLELRRALDEAAARLAASPPGDPRPWAEAVLEAMLAAQSAIEGPRPWLPERASGQLLALQDLQAERCAELAGLLRDSEPLAARMLEHVVATLRTGSREPTQLDRHNVQLLVARQRGTVLACRALMRWSGAELETRNEYLASMLARLPLEEGERQPAEAEPLRGLVPLLSAEHVPALVRAAELAAQEGRPASAAGLALLAHGFAGGTLAEPRTLRAILEAPVADAALPPLELARRELARAVLPLLPLPDPELVPEARSFNGTFRRDGVLLGTPAAWLAGLEFGSLEETWQAVERAGIPRPRFELEAATGGTLEVRQWTDSERVPWYETLESDNSAALQAHLRALADVEAELQRLTREIDGVQSWIGYDPGNAAEDLRWTVEERTPDGVVLESTRETLGSVAARQLSSTWREERARLIGRYSELVQSFPPEVETHVRVHEEELTRSWQEWSGTVRVRYRFETAAGTSRFEFEVPLDDLRLVRHAELEAAGVPARDEWVSEDTLREACRREVLGQLHRHAETALQSAFRALAEARARATTDPAEAAWLRVWFVRGELDEEALRRDAQLALLFGSPDLPVELSVREELAAYPARPIE